MLLLIFGIPASSSCAEPSDAARGVKQIVAHRGASSERPECTVVAIRRAIEVGATAVEVDVRTSKDGVLFILHDTTLDRTTNGSGPANKLTIAQLRQLDAGTWFDPKFKDQRIPTLQEVLETSRGKIDVLLDLKEKGKEYAESVVKEVLKHGDPQRTIIGVRSVDQARQFRKLLPKARQLGLIPNPDSIETFAKAGVETIRLWPRWLEKEGDELVGRVRQAKARLHLNGSSGTSEETIPLLKFRPYSLSSDDPNKLLQTLARIAGPAVPPRDTRLGPLRGERGDFSFAPAMSREMWSKRAEHVRHTMLVSMGLQPMPSKTPLNAVIHGKIDQGDYTIERVYFESIPGFYVTGSLYRPKGGGQKRPAVLSPHGHFPGGRFLDAGGDAVRRQIARGAEHFEDGGRSFMQSRCVQLARMGCVVFHYDMIGYGDSTQLALELVHRFSRSRVKFDKPPPSGFYSASAELRLQNPLGLHTYNSIRALDFLTSLPDVDSKRVAVTGGSGGGTQTFMLCAVDDRPLVSVPVVIVSADRQGGCTCENISHFRLGTYNLEFTALHAPKPLLLISADDATRTMRERGFPELRQHYKTLGVEQNVSHVPLLHFPHNYNYVSRAAMYHWLNQHLSLGLDEPIVERPYKRLAREQLTVWNDKHPRPEGGPEFEQQLLDWLDKDAKRQMTALRPRDRKSLEKYRHIVGGAWDVMLRRLPEEPEIKFPFKTQARRGEFEERRGLLRYQTVEGHQAELPMVQLVPSNFKQRTVIWISRKGKVGLFDNEGLPTDSV
ncbi:MAG: acetylxylan esterase, partial [Planctomycetes bacterium]|nr:acetylxylan esterase [Planctomycetota bacterium]